VHLRADAFWHSIARGWIPPWLGESHAQNQVVMDVLASAACRFAVGGYTVVVDGIVGPWFIDVFLRAAQPVAIRLDYVILRPSEGTAVARAINRNADELRDTGPIRQLYQAFTDLGPYEAHVIDTTDLDIEATAAAAWSGLRRGRFLLLPGELSQPE
jgi:hypothetical protein